MLSDVVLGPDRGTTLVGLALSLRPGLRVVWMSGYAPDPEATAAVLGSNATFLPKPFDRASLLRTLGGPVGP